MRRALLLLALARTAFAQAPVPDPSPSPSPTGLYVPTDAPSPPPEPSIPIPLRVQPEDTLAATASAPVAAPLPAPASWLTGAPFTPQTYPMERLRRPLTLAPGMLEIVAAFLVDLSSGVAGDRLALAAEGRYAIAPFVELGAEAGTFDVRKISDGFRGAVYARRQVADWLALRGDFVMDRTLVQVEQMTPAGGTELVSDARRRIGAVAGTPLKLAFTQTLGLEALERVFYVRTNPRTVTLAGPLSLLWQPLPYIVVEVSAAPVVERPTDAIFTLPVTLGGVLSFGNSTDLALHVRALDTTHSLDGRDLTVNLTMRM